MIDIDDIKQTEYVAVEPQEPVEIEYKDILRKEKELNLRKSEHELRESQQNTILRKKYLTLNFALTCGWLAIVLVIVICQGLHVFGFNLHDAVLITLLSTTTANIIGVLLIVITYLFKSHPSK